MNIFTFKMVIQSFDIVDGEYEDMSDRNGKVKKIAVTNRHLCYDYFCTKGLAKKTDSESDCLISLLEKLAANSSFDAIILREKDMEQSEYAKLAKRAFEICKQNGKELIVHTFPEVANQLGCALHLPFCVFTQNTDCMPEKQSGMQDGKPANAFGTSVHSVEDAVYAESHGAAYIIAGHIFETDCKKGLQGRGLAWLREVCKAVSVPVYAIGGITEQNVGNVMESGASGFCMMSSVLAYADRDGI